MISGGKKCKEIDRRENRAKTGLCETLQSKRILYEISTLLLNHSATHLTPLRKFSQLRSQVWHTSATSQHKSPHFEVAKLQSVKMPIFAVKASFCRVFRSCKTKFGTRVPFCSTVIPLSQLRNGLRSGLRK